MKTKILWQSLLMLLLIVLLSGCSINGHTIQAGSGNMVKEEREVDHFDQVQLDGFGEIILQQGDTESLVIEAEDNLLPYITTKMRGNTLEIGFKHNISVTPTRVIHYYLTVKDLNNLELSGGCNLKAEELQTDHLSIDMNGGGSVKFEELTTDLLEVKFSGAGSFEARGNATKQIVEFDGAGGYEAGDLKSQETTIRIDGLGNATVWAEDSLELTINGAGMIAYYDEPKVIQHTAGLGNINSLGMHP